MTREEFKRLLADFGQYGSGWPAIYAAFDAEKTRADAVSLAARDLINELRYVDELRSYVLHDTASLRILKAELGPPPPSVHPIFSELLNSISNPRGNK
jgi:hypothetical protein